MLIPFRYLFRSQLASHSGWMAMSGLVQAVVAFMANLVLVRYIEPEGFGRYAVSMASISLVMTMTSLRIGTQIIRIEDKKFDDEKRIFFFNAILQEVFFSGSIVFGVLYFSHLLDWWSAILLFAALVGLIADNNKVIYERNMPYKKLSFLEAGVNISGNILSVFIVVLGGHVAALYMREMFYGILTLFLLRKVGAFKWYKFRLVKLSEWRGIVKNNKGVWLDAILENSFSRIIMILAKYVGGEKGAGYLFQAYRLAGVPHQLLGPLAGRISFNWFSRQDNYKKRYKGFKQLILYMSVPLLISAVLSILYADRLVPFLFGEAWTQAAHLLISLTGYMIFVSLFEVQKSFLVASYQTRYLMIMRFAQYLGIAIITVPIVLSNSVLTGATLGMGVSVAYMLAFVVGIWLILTRSTKQ